jgi:outer membrane protein TolC
MLSKRFNDQILFYFLFLSFITLSGENHSSLINDSYLSKLKNESFELKRQNVTKQADELHDSWLNPVYMGYSYNIDNQPDEDYQYSQRAYISIDQPIFKSGGIYYAIKYAEALKSANLKSIEEQKKQLIKTVISILYNIKNIDIQLKKQEYLIKNAQIDLERKQELYTSGQLDSSYVDNALLAQNIQELTKLELENSRQTLIIQLEEISDVDPQNITLPVFKLISQKEFLTQDLSLQELNSRALSTKYNKKMQFSRYFPSVSVNAGYYWSRTEGLFMGGMQMKDFENDYWQAGITVSIPIIDFNRGYSNEIARIEYLEAQLNQKDKEQQLKTEYSISLQKLNNIDKKIKLAEKNLVLYANILQETKDLYEAGRKTKLDFENLQNSMQIKDLEIQSLEVEKQLLLIDLI